MEDLRKTVISATTETPTTSVLRSSYDYRYAYARSLDSRNEGDNGQDYLVILESETRLAFSLCDGVSQSFYGDIAARLLGEAIVEHLFYLGLDRTPADITQDINDLMQSLVVPASKIIQEYKIPDNLPAMLQKALDTKRTLGSESTLVGGVANFESGKVVFAWLGDSNLRVWGPTGELSDTLGDTFLTEERWSSRKGPVGKIHVFSGSTKTISRIAAYSDGLNRINERLRFDSPQNAEIDEEIDKAGDDDISFFEMIIKNQLPSEKTGVGTPIGVCVQETAVALELIWQAVTGATSYEVELLGQQGEPTYQQTKTAILILAAGDIPTDLQTVRVRAWKDAEPGNWSKSIIYHPPSKKLKDDNPPTPPPGPVGGSGEGTLPPSPPSHREKRPGLPIIFGCLLVVALLLFGYYVKSVMTRVRVTPTMSFTHTATATGTPTSLPTNLPSISPTNTFTDSPTTTTTNTPSPDRPTPTTTPTIGQVP